MYQDTENVLENNLMKRARTLFPPSSCQLVVSVIAGSVNSRTVVDFPLGI